VIDKGAANMYRLYADGACKGNPGRGGWGYLIKRDDVPGFSMEQAGSEDYTTNNRMELLAVIQGLKSIPSESKVQIVTDSTYVITVSASRNPKIKNLDLVNEMKRELNRLDFSFTWVKGHSGHEENELVDKLASMAAKGEIGFVARENRSETGIQRK